MNKIFVGVDPGLTGAIAELGNPDLLQLEWVNDLPVEYVPNTAGKLRGRYVEPELRKMFLPYSQRQDVLVLVETQTPMPDQSSVSTASTFLGFGLIRGILAGLQIPYELVSPRTWKKEMLEGLGADKGQALIKARALFPCANLGRRKDAGRAEALLIAEYGRRKFLRQGVAYETEQEKA